MLAKKEPITQEQKVKPYENKPKRPTPSTNGAKDSGDMASKVRNTRRERNALVERILSSDTTNFEWIDNDDSDRTICSRQSKSSYTQSKTINYRQWPTEGNF